MEAALIEDWPALGWGGEREGRGWGEAARNGRQVYLPTRESSVRYGTFTRGAHPVTLVLRNTRGTETTESDQLCS